MSYDYTFCMNPDCKLRETCWRYRIGKDIKLSSMCYFHPNNSGSCDYYIPEKEDKRHG